MGRVARELGTPAPRGILASTRVGGTAVDPEGE